MKRVLSFLLVLVMLLGMSPVLVLESNAAVSQINYVYGSTGKFSNVITNWGKRGETATFLSQNADAFYKTQGTNYQELASLSGSSNRSSVPSSPLYKELQTLMKSAHKTTTSYDATKELYKYTDCQNSSSSSISSFYSGTSIGPGWNQGPSWNREHTWPNSKGLGGADENDIMMLRPTATSENSSRGNTAYGEGSSYYNPNEASGGKYDLRGDVARIMLYTYVRWGNTGKMWGTGGVMESETVLLKWMEEDPVDTWELGRNDSVQSITGTRNVFVDYPELVFLMFGRAVPEDMPTPSGAAASGEVIPTQPILPTEPTEPAPIDYVTQPQTGVPYKFRTVQKNVGKTLYITGQMNGYYYETTEDINQAADVYLEAVSGGYRLFMLQGGVKTYLEIIKNGTYTNVVFTTSPTKTLKWNSSIASVTCDVDGTDFYFGNYSSYETFSASKISFVTGNNASSFDETNFVGHFIATDGEVLPDVPTDPVTPTEPQPTEPTEPSEPSEPADPVIPENPTYTTQPVTGQAYYFVLTQQTLGKKLYITGQMDGYYYATTEATGEAAVVYLEAAADGYRLYTLVNGTKTYLEMAKSGTHNNVVFVTAPTKVLKWNAEIASVTCDIEGEDFYFGTYGSYKTFSASQVSRVTGTGAATFDTTNFVAHLEPANGTPVEPSEPTEPTEPSEPVVPENPAYITAPQTGKAYKFFVNQKTVGKTLYITGQMNGYYYATTEDVNQAADVYFEAASGGYRLYTLNGGVKNYLEIVKNDTHTNVVFTTSPTKTLTWNDAIASVTCDVEGTDHYFGAYKTFETLSASKITYVTGENAGEFDVTNFVGHFLEVGGQTPDVPTDPTDPTEPSEPKPTDPVVPSQGTYEKITDLSQLTTGKYVMVAETGYAPGVLDGSWLSAVAPSVAGNTVTDAKGAVWTITVSGDSVTLTDANGVTVAPKGGNTNGIKEGDYSWKVTFEKNAFRFAGTGSDTVMLASNKASANQFRAYKTTTVADTASYPSYFTLYKLVETTPEEPPVDEPELIPGDLDGNQQVSADDVVALLLYLSMSDVFPLPEGAEADFTGDGAVTTDDAVALLLYISMPDQFPLA